MKTSLLAILLLLASNAYADGVVVCRGNEYPNYGTLQIEENAGGYSYAVDVQQDVLHHWQRPLFGSHGPVTLTADGSFVAPGVQIRKLGAGYAFSQGGTEPFQMNFLSCGEN